MRIATIIQSTSHLDYRARVLDVLETATPPVPEDYCLGQWVGIPVAGTLGIGVIYNSQLIAPGGEALGPRLSTPLEQNLLFAPDYVREQGIFLSILLVGWRDAAGYHQGGPRLVLPVQAPVEMLGPEEILAFHRGPGGGISMAYYALMVPYAGLLASSLVDAILDQLDRIVGEHERSRLRILRQSLAWQWRVEALR